MTMGKASYNFRNLLFSPLVVSNSLRPHGLHHARLPCPSLSPSLFKLISVESVMPSNDLILCHPLLPLPSIFPSIRVFSNESVPQLYDFPCGTSGKESTCQFRRHKEMQVRFLSPEDPLEEGMATHSSVLAWRIPMD